ncbi:MAG TPA: GNAT family N-acetyltransferase, partial [Candidatus Limnocylindria bacterium]
MTVPVRPARPADLQAIEEAKMAAGLAAWPHIFPRETLERFAMPPRWAEILRAPGPRSAFLVAELDGAVVGFAVVRPSGDEDAAPSTGELDAFYTAPSVWGRGAGRALLEAA